MNLTDKKAIRIYNNLLCVDLLDSIDNYPEDEIDGKSDMELITDEISYFKSIYEEKGHAYNNNLISAKKLLATTKQGKLIPLNSNTLKPKTGYDTIDIQNAKAIIKEYNQLKYYSDTLSKIAITTNKKRGSYEQ